MNIKKCAVIGAGLMGSGIARILSLHNLPVTLIDKDEDALNRGLEATTREGQYAYRIFRADNVEKTAVDPLISGSVNLGAIKDADLIIESVSEDSSIKENVLKEISLTVSDSAIIGSNTSTIPILRMAKYVKRPERFFGAHFFYPADKREFIEIVRSSLTDPGTIDAALSLAGRLGKIPVVVNDGPGFLVNRILVFYFTEAAYCLSDGLALEDIDRIMLRFGMAVGPAFLTDLVGADLCYSIARSIVEGIDSPRLKMPPLLEKLHQAKLRGDSATFYLYNGHEKSPNNAIYDVIGIEKTRGAMPEEHYLKRMLYTIINEASRCLEEGIASSAKTLDTALLLGMGFTFSAGGPLRYADHLGISNVVEELDRLKDLYGERFEPSCLLRNMSAHNKKFYDVFDLWPANLDIILKLIGIKARGSCELWLEKMKSFVIRNKHNN